MMRGDRIDGWRKEDEKLIAEGHGGGAPVLSIFVLGKELRTRREKDQAGGQGRLGKGLISFGGNLRKGADWPQGHAKEGEATGV